MIKIYVKFIVDSGGESPRQLLDRLRRIGGVPLIGEYDVEIMLGERERLFHKLEAVHRALKGSGASYSVSTGLEGVGSEDIKLSPGELKSLEVKKKFYREKLSKWKDMGIDTSVMEELLEKDLSKFKEISREYLHEHLEREKIAKAPSDPYEIDKLLGSTLDALGLSLDDLSERTGIEKGVLVLSLDRLISQDKIRMLVKDGKEVYLKVQKKGIPVAQVEIIPAKSEAEASQRVLAAIRTKGSTVKHIIRESRLPEGQVMNALAELLKSKRLRSAKRGRGTVYLRVPGK